MPFEHDWGMITQQLSFSILTAPLAAIDRRSLSQAWYSALHLAHATNSPTSCGRTSVDPPRIEGRPRRSGATSSAVRPGERAAPVIRTGHETSRIAQGPERRAERSPLARRIERTFLDPIRANSRATFTIDGTQARVHVALQTTASGVRLIAVCPAAIRIGVARALDEARYALALCGIALRIDVSEA
ncbi:MAG: hypothetical protein WA629_06940 [Candidatus Aquilonibacter sp.]